LGTLPTVAVTGTDGRLLRGMRTRTAVLDAAVTLASEQGLDGLSLAQLAERLGVSKSGLFAHWRSKEELQLATVERAREQWIEHVVSPALRTPRGIRRLWTLHESRVAFYAAWALPGGCFFAHAGFEYSVRPGPVRDRLVAELADWLGLVERLVREAVQTGELHWAGEPEQLAFEIDAIGLGMVYLSRLLDPATVHRRSRAAVLSRLRSLCPNPALLPEA
jgi:AcrR family transcriptional regulator